MSQAQNALPGWFDKDHYSRAKLAALKAQDPTCTAERMAAAFASAGFAGDDGLFRHFLAFGQGEDLAPNALFDANEYYAAKAANYYGKQSVNQSEVAFVKQAIHNSGLNAWSHYVACGAAEGVNPSNSFDDDIYLAAKLAQVRETDPAMTLNGVKTAFASIGMTPLAHYLSCGKDEGFIRNADQLAVADPVTVIPDSPNPFDPPTGLPSIELSGANYRTLLRAEFPAGTSEGQVVLNAASTGKGLYVSNVSDLTLYLRGRSVIEEDDTPYDDAIYGNTMLNKVTITGDAGASLAVEGIRANTVDAAALNGSLSISLSERHATTVIGSQGNDVFETDGMADVITGGNGNDTFRIGDDLDGPFTARALARVPTITDFSRGDTISFAEASSRLQGFASRGQVSATGEENLIATIRDYLTGNERGILVVHYNGDTYLAANGDARDTDDDAVVHLVGVYNQADLAATGAEVSIA